MTGRVIIVTGSSSGLGYETARYLCEGGNDVILACRNEEKAKRAIEKIKRQNPNALATFMHLDLTDLESVRKFVDDFHSTEKKLHVLVNNAGVALGFKDTKRQYTKDNFELTLGTNHLGHYLLTNLLLEDLKKAGADGGEARVVNVTSSVHDPETMKRQSNVQALDLDNLLLANEGTYNGLQAYKNSKLANIMFTYELARRLEGSGVVANCVCPGFIPSTDLVRNASGAQKFFVRYVLHGVLRFTKMTRTVQQGANAICNLITDEKFKEINGKYFRNGAEQKSSEESLDEEKQKKLWEMSGGLTRLEGYEVIEVPPPPVEEEKKEEAKEEKKEETAEAEASKEKEEKTEDVEEKKEEENKEEDVKKDEKEPEDKDEPEDKKEEPVIKAEEDKKEKPEEVKAEA